MKTILLVAILTLGFSTAQASNQQGTLRCSISGQQIEPAVVIDAELQEGGMFRRAGFSSETFKSGYQVSAHVNLREGEEMKLTERNFFVTISTPEGNRITANGPYVRIVSGDDLETEIVVSVLCSLKKN